MKKILSMVLCLCMIMSLFSGVTLNVSALIGGTYDIFDYTIKNGEVTITDCDTSISGDVVIPSTIGGYPVTTIGVSAFSDCTSLESVNIPNSVNSIGGWAFLDCYSLKEITLPNSISTIEEMTFARCKSLAVVSLPQSVSVIGEGAFSDCISLTNIAIPNSTRFICDGAFAGTSLLNVKIPANIEEIGYNVFYQCNSLEDILVSEDNMIYSSVDGVLYNKEKTELIKYPLGKKEAFYIIPNSVNVIGIGAFQESPYLKRIVIPSSVDVIDNGAFYKCAALESVTIVDGLTTIYHSVFQNCTELKTVTLPKSLTSIGLSSFDKCDSLETVYFNGSEEEWNKIEILGDMNVALTSANIIFVCDHTFSNNVCSKCGTTLNVSTNGKFESVDTTVTGNITVPLASNGVLVSTIGAGAFKDCASLSSVMVYDSVTEIADDAFDGVSDNFVIKCYEDSPASAWAEEKGVRYEIVPIPYGNVNADEATDIFDLIALAKHTVDNKTVIDTRAANTNAPDKADRNIDIFDLIALAKHICNPEFTLGPKA